MTGVPLTIVAATGPFPVEFAVRANGSCPARDFFQNDCENIREGSKLKPDSTARSRFAFLFRQMATAGRLPVARFGREMGHLWAFKHEVRNVQIRFPCFQDGSKWIVTHGFEKPGAKRKLGDWPQSEIDRAEAIRTEYFARKNELAKKAGKK